MIQFLVKIMSYLPFAVGCMGLESNYVVYELQCISLHIVVGMARGCRSHITYLSPAGYDLIHKLSTLHPCVKKYIKYHSNNLLHKYKSLKDTCTIISKNIDLFLVLSFLNITFYKR